MVHCVKKNLATRTRSAQRVGSNGFWIALSLSVRIPSGKGREAPPRLQGCQMVYFQTKNPNFDPVWRALDRKIWIYFMAILIIYRHLVFIMTI
jgi:hypothetical protein